MTVLVTKANSDYWYKIEEYSTIEELYEMMLKRKHSILLSENIYNRYDKFEFWDGMKEEDIYRIMNTKLHITIVNDYI